MYEKINSHANGIAFKRLKFNLFYQLTEVNQYVF